MYKIVIFIALFICIMVISSAVRSHLNKKREEKMGNIRDKIDPGK